jgi:hypothetical protein
MSHNKNTEDERIPFTIDIDHLVDFIVSVIKSDSWCKDYTLANHERTSLHKLLHHEINHQHLNPRLPFPFQQLVLIGLDYVKRLPSYIQLQQDHYRKQAAEQLQKANIPLSQYPQITTNLKLALTPADCAALKDWPDGRLSVAGTGRLENAGQFMQRLLDDKLYDETQYGELYMPDLRSINPKLYLALSQWQNRSGKELIKKKSEQIAKLEQTAEQAPQTLDFIAKSKASNARWRKKRVV